MMFQPAFIAVLLVSHCFTDTVCSDSWFSRQRSSQIKHKDEDATMHADPGNSQDQQTLQFSPINARGTRIETREEIINENPLPRAENNSRQVYRAGSSILEIIGLLREHPYLEIHPKITDPHHSRYSVPSKPQNGNISVLKPAPELGIPDSKVGFSEFSNTRTSKAGQLTRADGANRETNLIQPLRISLSSLDSDAEPGTDFPVGLNTRAYGTEKLRRAVSSYSQSLLTDYLKSSLNLPQVDRVRNLIGNPLLRPILERMLPQPLTEIPYNVHDDVGGIFLRVLLSRKEGPAVLELIKLIAKNVSVVKEKGKDKYRINAVCLLMSSRKILKSFNSSSSSKDSSSSLSSLPSSSSSSSSSSASLERSKSDIVDMIRSKSLSRSLSRSLDKRLGGSFSKRLGGSFSKSFGGSRRLNPSPSTRVEYEFGDSESKESKNKGCKNKESEACKVNSMSNLRKYIRAKKPKGFEDGVGGMFLKCAVFYPDAPVYLNALKAVVNNVRIEKLPEKSGKLKSHYHIDFLGFAKSPGISPLFADIRGIPGELIRAISEGSGDQSQDSS